MFKERVERFTRRFTHFSPRQDSHISELTSLPPETLDEQLRNAQKGMSWRMVVAPMGTFGMAPFLAAGMVEFQSGITPDWKNWAVLLGVKLTAAALTFGSGILGVGSAIDLVQKIHTRRDVLNVARERGLRVTGFPFKRIAA